MKDYIKIIFRLILGVLLIGLMANCSTVQKIPVENKYEIVKKDSIIYTVKDSVNIIPIEKIVNKTLPDQKSSLETSLAKSEAYTDSLGFLHHSIENKKQFTQHIHKEEKETVKTDSVYVEKPVPYEVVVEKPYIPKFYKFTLYWFIATVILLILGIYLKFKP